MATAKPAIWLELKDSPAPIKAQKRAASTNGADTDAIKRFNVASSPGGGAYLSKFLLPWSAKKCEFAPSIRASAPLDDYSNNHHRSTLGESDDFLRDETRDERRRTPSTARDVFRTCSPCRGCGASQSRIVALRARVQSKVK